MNSPNTVFSQCDYSFITGCSGGTVPPVVGASSTYSGNVCINSNVTINSGITLIISAANVSINGNYEITVSNGAILNIIDANIFGNPNMWKGIVGLPGSTIYVDGSSIHYADIALNVSGTATAVSMLTVKNSSCFKNNDIGIFLEASSPTHITHTIEHTEFWAPNLVFPKSGQIGDYGVLVKGSNIIDPGPYFRVGNFATYTGSVTFNYFHDLAIAVRGFESNLSVQNCKIENTKTTCTTCMPTGTPVDELPDYELGNVGILATSQNLSPNFERTLLVGNNILSPGIINNFINNTSTSGFIGIVAETQQNSIIQSNFITSGYSGTDYRMSNAILVRFPKSDHTIANNTIQNFKNQGIRSLQINDGVMTITNNNFDNTASQNGEVAIRIVDMPTTVHNVSINNNTMNHIINGIVVNGMSSPQISSNTITFLGGGLPAIGINVIGTNAAYLYDNTISGDCISSSCSGNVRGIQILNSTNTLADKNRTEFCSAGMWYENAVTNGNLTCNGIHSCFKGMMFYNIGGSVFSPPIGPVKTGLTDAADDGWFPATFANRIHAAEMTNMTYIDIWRYKNTDPSFLMSASLMTQSGGALLPTPTLSSGMYCDLAPRQTGDAGGEADALEEKYTTWATQFISEETPDNLEYYKAWDFWREMQFAEYPEGLSDELTAAYEKVTASNIPDFYALQALHEFDELDSAIMLNSAIIPANAIEETLQKINTIYYNGMDETSKHFILTEADETILEELALLNGFDYGFGVNAAWTLLDMEIITPITFEEEKNADTNKLQSIIIYPNPSGNYFYFDSECLEEEPLQIKICNLQGDILITDNDAHKKEAINISTLPSGMYLLQFNTVRGETTIQKLIINKSGR